MRTIMLMLLIALTFGATSCINKCSNPEVTAFFDRHIYNIETQLQKTEIVSGKSMLSILVLQEVTDIKSSVQFGDTSVYDSDEDMKSDKRKWMSWLGDNICNVTGDDLEALEQGISIKYPYFIDSGQ